MNLIDKQNELNEKLFKLKPQIFKIILNNDSTNYPQEIKTELKKYHEDSIKFEESNNILSKIESYISKSKILDNEIRILKNKLSEDKSTLYDFSTELSEIILYSYYKDESYKNPIIQPLLDIDKEIQRIQLEIQKLDEINGFIAKTKAQAQKAIKYSKLKIAEIQKKSSLKKIGSDIIEFKKEDEFRTATNNPSIEKIKQLREIYNNSHDTLESKVTEQIKYWERITQTLNIESIKSTNDLFQFKKIKEKEISDYRGKKDTIEQDIIKKILSNLSYKWNLYEIDLIIAIKKELKEIENQKKLQTKIKISEMQFLDKDELDSFFGASKKDCPSSNYSYLNYISGIPCIDEIIKQSPASPNILARSNILARLDVRPKGLHIRINTPEQHHIGLLHKNIQIIDFEDKDQIFKRKDKSVIGRAIVGGLICFPIFPLGALIGAMSGIGYKEEKANMPDLLLAISYENNNKGMILFSAKYEQKTEIETFFNSYFLEKFRFSYRDFSSPESSKVENESDVDKIRKFKKLFDDGIITKKEFETKKKQILMDS